MAAKTACDEIGALSLGVWHGGEHTMFVAWDGRLR